MVFTLDFWPAYLIGLGALVVYLLGMWLYSLYVKNAGLIDSMWAIGVILVGWLYYLLVSDVTQSARGWLIMGLVTVWGLRLAWIPVLTRDPNEDVDENLHYAALRAQYGKRWWWLSLFRVYLSYAPLIWIVSVPMLAVHLYRSGPTTIWLDWVGAAVWAVGFLFDVFAGRVSRIIPRVHILSSALQWWGIFLIAASTPNGWLTVVSPILMTVVLLRGYIPSLSQQDRP